MKYFSNYRPLSTLIIISGLKRTWKSAKYRKTKNVNTFLPKDAFTPGRAAKRFDSR